MCNFFSFNTFNGKFYSFNWIQRQQILQSKLLMPNGATVTEADSHSQIAAFYNIDIDKCNSYEWDFFNKKLIKDNIRTKDNYNDVLLWCKKLKVTKIVKPLIIKKIINPIKMKKQKISIDESVLLLKQWDAVWNAVGNAVGDAVVAYLSSFFTIKYKHDFSSCIKLWESGYVPSFDGITWRLHGYNGKILWEGKI